MIGQPMVFSFGDWDLRFKPSLLPIKSKEFQYITETPKRMELAVETEWEKSIETHLLKNVKKKYNDRSLLKSMLLGKKK